MPSGFARVCTTSIVCGWQLFGDEETCSRSARDRVAKRHRFGGGGGFVEQRGVGDIERGQVGDHRLEIEQRLEPALRDLGLIGRVGGVPAGIFQNVALDHRRHDAIGITRADEAARDFVLARNLAQFRERFLLRFAGREIERLVQADVFRDGRIDQIVEVLEADRRRALRDFLVVRPDVAR